MPRPICFMIMPYGKKPTSAPNGSQAPDKVDFDRLWEVALRVAIERAGYDPIRANEDTSALIIVEMIERLAISDMVIADVSIPNGNVYYEVGIRHAAQRAGCMLTAADWAKPLFDVAQMRHIRYPLPEEAISDETAARIVEIICAAIPEMARGDSPFYQVFPQFPIYDPSRTTSFRAALQGLFRFQAEIIVARSASDTIERRTRALTLRDQYYTGRTIQKAIAIELLFMLRDCTDWQTTLEFIRSLPDDIQDSPLVIEQRALALSNSGDHDAAIGALRELIRTSGGTSERHGLLGGRYKKRFQKSNNSVDLGLAIAEYETGMKLDLNDYYPSSNLARLYRKRNRKGDQDKAVIAAAVAMTACERAKNRNSNDEWLNPTLLGAAFDAGNVEKAQELAELVRLEGQAAWKLDSTLGDCRVAAEMQEEPRRSELLEIIASLQPLVSVKQNADPKTC